MYPASCYEVVDPYEQRNARAVKDEGKLKGKKKQQKSQHNVKKQQSEVVNGANGKAKLGNFQQNMFNNESNHLYRHSMSSENMSGGMAFSNKEE